MKPSRVGLLRHTLRGCVDWNPNNRAIAGAIASHTLRGCVDWNKVVVSGIEQQNLSHPSWVCGLKPTLLYVSLLHTKSHPSWVCGLKHQIPLHLQIQGRCHTLRGCVDWNNNDAYIVLRNDMSHPSWVCGLKLDLAYPNHDGKQSHPSWVCGLKQSGGGWWFDQLMSHPSWVCGYKWVDEV